MKAIILYYSRSGNTEKYAKALQKDLGIQAVKIEPEEAYGNYIMSCFRVMKENPDLSGYDTIFLGYPVWAQDVPAFVQEFVRQCDTAGKTIIPFATYGMSGINWTMKTLHKLFPDSEIKLPFDNGVVKKGNYEKWLGEIKKL